MKSKNEVFSVVKHNIKDILFDVADEDIQIELCLRDLGANSVDRADIVTQSMADLGLKIPLIDLATVDNLEGLVDLFYDRQTSNAI